MSRADPVAVLKRRLAAMPDRLRRAAQVALLQAGQDVVADSRRRLAQPDGPRPSAPGGPPRDTEGRLASSLTVTLDEAASRVIVSATNPHAAYLEYGTRRMAPRPFLRPAVEETRPAAVDHCRQALTQAVRDPGGQG